MSQILYVTTFNKKLYDLIGYKLLDTFFQYETQGDLLVVYEDNIRTILEDQYSNKILYHNLCCDNMLSKWLKDFHYLIPLELGGSCKPCQCLNISKENKWNGHEKRCIYAYFNYRASQWFRKIVALNYSLTLNRPITIFVDADIIFTKKLYKKTVQDVFHKNVSVFYHQGHIRKNAKRGVESGFIGFHRDNGGYIFLKKVIDVFINGDFQKYDRWDDGYIFKMLIHENKDKNLILRDVVDSRQVTPGQSVSCGPFNRYIKHYKGIARKKIQNLKA